MSEISDIVKGEYTAKNIEILEGLEAVEKHPECI